MKKKGLRIHKMEDWKQFRLSLYQRFIWNAEHGGFDERKMAYRILDNKWGIYESRKTYEDGVAYNDGSWMIFTTSRVYKDKDKTIYKDKVFCKDKDQVIADLYSYILFLRKIGVEEVYEMYFYAIAFLTKYIRFVDKVFNCTKENQMKIGELCQAACKKEPDEIDCESRKDTRKFAFDPDITRKMIPADIVRWQNRIEKQITDEQIKKWYNPKLSVRKNVIELKLQGLEISVGRMYQWIKEYIKD